MLVQSFLCKNKDFYKEAINIYGKISLLYTHFIIEMNGRTTKMIKRRDFNKSMQDKAMGVHSPRKILHKCFM
jgi:hypothetical protein